MGCSPHARSFYKIMLPSIINDHKMRIPEDFARIYEKELSSYATLIVPNGQVFSVQVEKADKMLWLHNGWKIFAEHHSIRCGFFLVFDYEGNSNFKVNIYDLTATEVKYPKTSIGTRETPEYVNKRKVLRNRGTKSSQTPTSKPISSQTSTSRPNSVSLKDEIFNECSQRGEKRKICFHSVLPALFEFAPEYARRMNKYGKCIKKSFLDSLRSNRQYETRHKRFKAEAIFETNMLENVIRRKGTLKAITEINSPIESENDDLIILEKCENHVDSSGGSEIEMGIESDIDELISDNHENLTDSSNELELQECIKSKNDELIAENLVKTSRFLNESELKESSESENDKFIPEYYENVVENSRSSNESELQNHTRTADKKDQQSAEDLEDRHLATEFNEDKDHVNVKHEEGGRSNVVNVSSIFLRKSRIQEKQKALNDALMLKLKNPYFMIILKQKNVHRASILQVPAYFGKKYISSDTQYLKLEGPAGKHWKVSCFVNSEVQYLGRGWFEFVNDKNLLEGDVCIFELIQVDNVVLKVHIFRTCQTSLYNPETTQF